MKLTRTERWILSNQYRIMEAPFYPNEADSLKEHREALESGYELHYRWMCEHIYDEKDTLSEDQCREVLEILDMFRALKYAYDDLADKSGIEEWQIEFAGFDGNNETTLMGYTRYFCDSDGGKFKELKRGDNFNSHMPTLPAYRRMLAEWRKSPNAQKLTKPDIQRITAAWKHPD